MKSFILISLLIFFGKPIRAQVNLQELRAKLVNANRAASVFCIATEEYVKQINDSDRIVSIGSYKSYIDKYFTYLSYNRGVLPAGNSAAIELSNNSTLLNLSLSKKIESKDVHGPVTLLTAGVKAKINDGISQLFSGGSINSGTSLFANFSFLPGRSLPIKAVIRQFDEFGQPVPSDFDRLKQRRSAYARAFCKNLEVKYRLKYLSLIECWEQIKKELDTATVSCNVSDLVKKKEEIEKDLEKSGLLLKDSEDILKADAKEFSEKMYELEIESKAWLYVKFFWLSGGIVYTRQSYDTYDNSAVLSKRFDSRDFDEVEFNLTANWFKQLLNSPSFIGSTYFNISYQSKSTNSYLSLKTSDISRIILRSPSPADTVYNLQDSKKVRDITNKPYKNGRSHTLSSTATAMLGKNQNTGINLRASFTASPLHAPMYSTHIGALLKFVNNNADPTDKNSTAKVNFELFMEFDDMSDVGRSGKSVWQNKSIGINTSVPFSKIFFK